jgi:hypothetical protein
LTNFSATATAGSPFALVDVEDQANLFAEDAALGIEIGGGELGAGSRLLAVVGSLGIACERHADQHLRTDGRTQGRDEGERGDWA